MLRRLPALLALLTAVGGCSAASSSSEDVRLHARGDTLYVLARSSDVSRGVCASLGGDVARAEGRWAPADGRSMELGRVWGCYTVRRIVVCPENDGACLSLDERHRGEQAARR
jgi:hypothetical protein